MRDQIKVKRAARKAETKASLKARGLCMDACGNPRGNHSLCPGCRAKRAKYEREKYHAKRKGASAPSTVFRAVPKEVCISDGFGGIKPADFWQ